VLIRIWVKRMEPLAGTAATEGSERLRFDGWLELLRVVSELVAAAPPSGEDADSAKRAAARRPGGDIHRLHPESPAQEHPDPGGAP
jgi:hypothetical protein